MNTTVIELVRGKDSKLYPARPLSRAERNEIRWRTHELVCGRGLSVRQAQRALAERYGVRRSVGTIARDLRVFECSRCEDKAL